MDGLPGLRGMKTMHGIRRVPQGPPGFSVFKRGPEWQQPLVKPPVIESIFWPPPLDFDTSSTSNSEWMPYAALWVIFKGPMALLRKPPYIGMPGFWTYQTYARGHHSRGHSADYMITPSSRFARKLIIRLQTEQYHNFTTSAVQRVDQALRAGLGRFNEVIDLPDDLILWDKSGRAVMYHVRRCLLGIDPKTQSRVTAGHSRRSRSAR